MTSPKKNLEKGKVDWFAVHLYLRLHTKKKTDRKLRKVGFLLCKDCNGKSFTRKRQRGVHRVTAKENLLHLCTSCGGTGFRDWVEEILR